MAMDIIEGIKGKNQNECYTLLLELKRISESSEELDMQGHKESMRELIRKDMDKLKDLI